MLNQIIEIKDSELRRFWGSDLAQLTPQQQQLVVGLFQAVKQRQLVISIRNATC